MPKGKAAKEAAALEAAMKQAAEDAQKLFKQHEKERKALEHLDKGDRDHEHFEKALEDDRLARERLIYADIGETMEHTEELIYGEHTKHQRWSQVMEASWLPSVDSECDINAFLSCWRDEQEIAMGSDEKEVNVNMRCTLMNQRQINIESLHLMRRDEGPTPSKRQVDVQKDLEMCTHANKLADMIWRDADLAVVKGDMKKVAFHRRNLINVYKQILNTLDTTTSTVLIYQDVFLGDDEHFLKALNNIKFGVWIKSSATMRGVGGGIHYPEPLDILIDPKSDGSSTRLPRILTKDNYALRAMQLNFDPYSITADPTVGADYYALDCCIVIELLYFAERSKRVPGAEWMSRVETPNSRILNKQEYPPKGDNKSGEDHTIKISFTVPDNVVIRPRQPVLGKWNPHSKKWDPCASQTHNFDPTTRVACFMTQELTSMALIQERGFDVPYEQWQLNPISNDQVQLVLEGRRRHECSDREIKILVKDHLCRLEAPDEKELTYLRENWLPPATLLRLLSRAGYNLTLSDADAEAMSDDLLPKTKEMETQGYYDVALFCTQHAFASTRHNKRGEDPNMCLFRVSKQQRADGEEKPFFHDVDDDDKWHSVRYEKERCVLARFKDSDEDPDLSNMPGKETHLNLYMTLASEYGDSVEEHVRNSNKLLQRSVVELLSLTRPFTFG